MNGKISVSAVIPVYNEEKSIIQTVDALKQVLKEKVPEFEIIVVNDGSTVLTAKALEERRDIIVINHPINRGYGRSLLSGIEKAKHEWILMIDAGGIYPPEEAEKLFEFTAEFDMVIGEGQGKIQTKFAKIIQWHLDSFVAKITTGRTFNDPASPLRLIKKEICDKFLHANLFLSCPLIFSTIYSAISGKIIKTIPVAITARGTETSNILRILCLAFLLTLHFSPLKLFLFLSILIAVISICCASSIIFVGSIILFSTGCLLDLLNETRRFH